MGGAKETQRGTQVRVAETIAKNPFKERIYSLAKAKVNAKKKINKKIY